MARFIDFIGLISIFSVCKCVDVREVLACNATYRTFQMHPYDTVNLLFDDRPGQRKLRCSCYISNVRKYKVSMVPRIEFLHENFHCIAFDTICDVIRYTTCDALNECTTMEFRAESGSDRVKQRFNSVFSDLKRTLYHQVVFRGFTFHNYYLRAKLSISVHEDAEMQVSCEADDVPQIPTWRPTTENKPISSTTIGVIIGTVLAAGFAVYVALSCIIHRRKPALTTVATPDGVDFEAYTVPATQVPSILDANKADSQIYDELSKDQLQGGPGSDKTYQNVFDTTNDQQHVDVYEDIIKF